MKVTQLRLSNFQSFGPQSTSIDLDDLTYVLGPNGAGKTTVLEALSRLFSPSPAQRKVRASDFHVPLESTSADVQSEESALWIEVDVEFPEAGDEGQHATIPPNFAHMRMDSAGTAPRIRVRLSASLEVDGVIDEKIEYIHRADEDGVPIDRADMSRHDRGLIEVHYLPARRDPSDHISYTTASLLGRTLRAADWGVQREALSGLAGQISDALIENSAVATAGAHLADAWAGLHGGEFFRDPALAFGRGDLEGVLQQLTIMFTPSHDGAPLPFDRLSDGQKSLLYISLVLAWQRLASRVLSGDENSLDVIRLRPPVHTIVALEEPENSLAPQYLGRIIRQLREACDGGEVQVLIATHASTLLRRVDPEAICFLRLNEQRETTVRRILMPTDSDVASKYVREAIEAYPELYFSRLVLLGEGDSEMIVLRRVLAAAGIADDDASVSVVPLGGRHVNHFWRLLNELEIPFVTLLDLDAGRHQAGWGRVRNAMRQVNAIRPSTFADEVIEALPAWNACEDFPKFCDNPFVEDHPVNVLEQQDVFFSEPVDLDLMMLRYYPVAYEVEPGAPDEAAITAVLGKGRANQERLALETLELFDSYHEKFDLRSKPASHLAAMAVLSDEQLLAGLPDVLKRMILRVSEKLKDLPE